MIKTKNIFTEVSDSDGFRVLIEPVWPKNASRKTTALDVWLRYLAPSPELYDRFSGNLISWEDFVARYHRELDQKQGSLKDLQEYNRNGGLTLMHGSGNAERNTAIALKMFLEKTGPAKDGSCMR